MMGDGIKQASYSALSLTKLQSAAANLDHHRRSSRANAAALPGVGGGGWWCSGGCKSRLLALLQLRLRYAWSMAKGVVLQ